MIAIIKKENNETYKSAVFAVYHKGYFSSFFIVDENKNIIEKEMHVIVNKDDPNSGLRQTIYIRELGDRDSWLCEDRWEGYDWFISDRESLDNIRKGGNISNDLKNAVQDANNRHYDAFIYLSQQNYLEFYYGNQMAQSRCKV